MASKSVLTAEQLEQRARMKMVLEHYYIDRQRFALITNSKLSYVNQMLSGDRKVSEIIMRRFCDIYQMVNFRWLQSGLGQMIEEDVEEEDEIEGVSEPETPYHTDPVASLSWVLRDHDRQLKELKAEIDILKNKLEKSDL